MIVELLYQLDLVEVETQVLRQNSPSSSLGKNGDFLSRSSTALTYGCWLIVYRKVGEI